jgi:hypothetical protein
MATYFRNTLISEIGVTEVLIASTTNTSRATFIGMSLTNLTAGIVLANIRLVNTAETAPNDTAYYIKDVVVPPNQSLRVINGGEKLVLAGDMEVYVQASLADSLDLVASYVEII